MLSLNFLAARARADELRRAAEGVHPDLDPEPFARDVTLRRAAGADVARLRRLAALDSRPAPRAALVAEVGGCLRAALPLDGAPPIADPFHTGEDLIELLWLRAAQLGLRPRPQRAAGARERRPAA